MVFGSGRLHPVNNTGWGWGSRKMTPKQLLERMENGQLNTAFEKLGVNNAAGPIVDMTKEKIRQEVAKTAVSDVIREADDQLKLEFKTWLAGRHSANENGGTAKVMYAIPQPPTQKVYWGAREQTFQIDVSNKKPHSTKDQDLIHVPHTHWGKAALTHLPGVRDFMAEDLRKEHQYMLDEAKLVHFGPQNLEEAWYYFNKFIKQNEVKKTPFQVLPPDGDDHNYGKSHPADRRFERQDPRYDGTKLDVKPPPVVDNRPPPSMVPSGPTTSSQGDMCEQLAVHFMETLQRLNEAVEAGDIVRVNRLGTYLSALTQRIMNECAEMFERGQPGQSLLWQNFANELANVAINATEGQSAQEIILQFKKAGAKFDREADAAAQLQAAATTNITVMSDTTSSGSGSGTPTSVSEDEELLETVPAALAASEVSAQAVLPVAQAEIEQLQNLATSVYAEQVDTKDSWLRTVAKQKQQELDAVKVSLSAHQEALRQASDEVAEIVQGHGAQILAKEREIEKLKTGTSQITDELEAAKKKMGKIVEDSTKKQLALQDQMQQELLNVTTDKERAEKALSDVRALMGQQVVNLQQELSNAKAQIQELDNQYSTQIVETSANNDELQNKLDALSEIRETERQQYQTFIQQREKQNADTQLQLMRRNDQLVADAQRETEAAATQKRQLEAALGEQYMQQQQMRQTWQQYSTESQEIIARLNLQEQELREMGSQVWQQNQELAQMGSQAWQMGQARHEQLMAERRENAVRMAQMASQFQEQLARERQTLVQLFQIDSAEIEELQRSYAMAQSEAQSERQRGLVLFEELQNVYTTNEIIRRAAERRTEELIRLYGPEFWERSEAQAEVNQLLQDTGAAYLEQYNRGSVLMQELLQIRGALQRAPWQQ